MSMGQTQAQNLTKMASVAQFWLNGSPIYQKKKCLIWQAKMPKGKRRRNNYIVCELVTLLDSSKSAYFLTWPCRTFRCVVLNDNILFKLCVLLMYCAFQQHQVVNDPLKYLTWTHEVDPWPIKCTHCLNNK